MATVIEQSKRDTRRYSSYTAISSAPSIAASTETSTFIEINEGLRRLDDRRLQGQRFVPSDHKTEMLSKLALGAKLERALSRRMDKQDAIPRPRAKSDGNIQVPAVPAANAMITVDEMPEIMDEKVEVSDCI